MRAATDHQTIEGAYTLFGKIDLVRDAEGHYWADPLWAVDIAAHQRYIPGFRLCCPVREGAPPPDWARIDLAGPIIVFEERPDRGFLSVALNILPNLLTDMRAAFRSDIVHSGGAGWAVPNSFALLLVRPFARFRWIMVIESMFWRPADPARASLRARIESALHEAILGRAVRRADVRIFTHAAYRDHFLKAGEEAMINPASWIEERDIVSIDALRARHGPRGARDLRLIFPARLIPDKGCRVLLEAVKILQARGAAVELDVVGEGPQRRDFEALADTLRSKSVRIGFPPMRRYGSEFFALLREYDAVLVPSLSDEQPRIVFDAFSQGTPVIAASTSGILSVVDEGCGLLFPPGDASALAAAIEQASADRGFLELAGLRALAKAREHTHTAMHRRRSEYLAVMLGQRPAKSAAPHSISAPAAT